MIVDDIVRSGSAINEISNMVKSMGGQIVGCACVIRFTSAPDEVDGVPIQSLVNFETESYKNKSACPMCKDGSTPENVRF